MVKANSIDSNLSTLVGSSSQIKTMMRLSDKSAVYKYLQHVWNAVEPN